MATGARSGAGTIVAGVDGSPASLEALAWAARQAALTGGVVLAVTTWQWPTTYGLPVPVAEGFDPAAEASRLLDEAVEETRRAHPGVDLRTSVVQGPAGVALVGASEGAELLVVGSRGHGELAGMLLGSVSERCVTHAHCPVLVVRH
jgi:nucleotide-binding universal stress UspA family protein